MQSETMGKRFQRKKWSYPIKGVAITNIFEISLYLFIVQFYFVAA